MNYELELSNRLSQVTAISDMRARSQMWKVYKNCKDAYTELSKESVECRRKKHVSVKYTELEAKLNESINVFDQWVILATLIYT
jgi:hypothetical protein